MSKLKKKELLRMIQGVVLSKSVSTDSVATENITSLHKIYKYLTDESVNFEIVGYKSNANSPRIRIAVYDKRGQNVANIQYFIKDGTTLVSKPLSESVNSLEDNQNDEVLEQEVAHGNIPHMLHVWHIYPYFFDSIVINEENVGTLLAVLHPDPVSEETIHEQHLTVQVIYNIAELSKLIPGDIIRIKRDSPAYRFGWHESDSMLSTEPKA